MPPKRGRKRKDESEEEEEDNEPEVEDDDDDLDDDDGSPAPPPTLSRAPSNRPKRQAQEKVAVAHEEQARFAINRSPVF